MFIFFFCVDILLVQNGSEELAQTIKGLREDQIGKNEEYILKSSCC